MWSAKEPSGPLHETARYSVCRALAAQGSNVCSIARINPILYPHCQIALFCASFEQVTESTDLHRNALEMQAFRTLTTTRARSPLTSPKPSALPSCFRVGCAIYLPAPELFLDRTLEFYRAANVEGGGSLASFKMTQRHGKHSDKPGAREDREEAARRDRAPRYKEGAIGDRLVFGGA